MRRFLAGATPAATALASLAMSALFALGFVLAERAVPFMLPRGSNLILMSATEPTIHHTVAAFVFCLTALAGWTIVAARGARTGIQEGISGFLVCTLPIAVISAAASFAHMLLIRSTWAQTLDDARQRGGVSPMVTLSSLEYWHWTLFGLLLSTAVVFLLAVLRAPGAARD